MLAKFKARCAYLGSTIALVLLTLVSAACGGNAATAGDSGPVTTPASQPVALTVAEKELSTAAVVKALAPSVVQIVTQSQVMGFRNRPIPTTGLGTGVILDEQGHILTNNHVIEGAQRITVTLSTGASYAADVVGTDPSRDLAVIQINATGLQPAKLGNSAELQVGEDVIAIGHALGLEGGRTVSKGVISALGRSIDADAQTTMTNLSQTDAAINPGNSGGTLVNTRAEVIGINTDIIQNSEGIGFSININDAKAVAERLIKS